MGEDVYDFIVIGSGFGGSVSAMRLAEKGYRVLVLERGRRFRDEDFATTTWNLRRYLWAPGIGCRGILQISPFRNIVVLHGAGVGGGSLGYGNVLVQPDDATFAQPAWRHLANWRELLQPHYAAASRMLGVTENPRLGPADAELRVIARELGAEHTFRAAPVGAFFGRPGEEGREVADPYFGGAGPSRRGCTFCGGCLVGCRHNAKNTLPKNYLYFAERAGALIRPDTTALDVRPLAGHQTDGARYEVLCRRTGVRVPRRPARLRARSVVCAAGTLGTLRLLLRCRDATRSLPALSPRLGEMVRTNNESLLGSVSRQRTADYSRGLAITSMFRPDGVTTIEPVRYPAGSSAMRLLAGPMIDSGGLALRVAKSVLDVISRPGDFLRTHVLPGWAERTTIVLAMQNEDSRIGLELGRSPLTLFRRDLVSRPDGGKTAPGRIASGYDVTRRFAARTGGIALGSINEGLFDVPITAHILGGCPFGRTAEDGVVDVECRVHGYPGLYVVDGSIVPGNPGVNPSLTITALAEYAMSRIPPAGHGRAA